MSTLIETYRLAKLLVKKGKMTKSGQYQFIVQLSIVELQLAVGLDHGDVDIERRQPGGVLPIPQITVAALEHCGHYPADEGLLS